MQTWTCNYLRGEGGGLLESIGDRFDYGERSNSCDFMKYEKDGKITSDNFEKKADNLTIFVFKDFYCCQNCLKFITCLFSKGKLFFKKKKCRIMIHLNRHMIFFLKMSGHDPIEPCIEKKIDG